MKDPVPQKPDRETDPPTDSQKGPELAPGLYMLGSPIGNLEDLGFRALRVLKQAKWVAAEDTRETGKLLAHFGIHTKLVSVHEHTTRSRIEELVSSLAEGPAVCAYLSDAGTPGLCDPGAELVNACAEAGVTVFPVPGASALMALVSVSGFRESAFRFEGFFPREKAEREAWAKAAVGGGGLQFFFESPHRIQGCLEFLAGHFPSAPLVVGRELTKRFETITRGSCASVFAEIGEVEPRGEYVLGLSLPAAEGGSTGLKEEELREFVKELAQLGAGQKVLVKAAMSHGMRKNEAYRLALELLEK